MDAEETPSVLNRPRLYAAIAAVLLVAAGVRASGGEGAMAGFALSAAGAAACCAGEAWTGRRPFLWAAGGCVALAIAFLWLELA